MSSKRLRIINRQKSIKHHKQWYKRKRRLKGIWTVEHIQELEVAYGLGVEEELVNILTQEITRAYTEEGLGNPYPDQEILDYIKEYKKDHEFLVDYVNAHKVVR